MICQLGGVTFGRANQKEDLDITAIDDPVRADVPENNAFLGDRKSKPVLRGNIGLPDIIKAIISVDIQRRMAGIL